MEKPHWGMADVIAIAADWMATQDGMVLIMADVIAFCGNRNSYCVNCLLYFILFWFLFIFYFYFKFWAVEQKLIPYVRQIIFSYIFI